MAGRGVRLPRAASQRSLSAWHEFEIPNLRGLDLKTNPLRVADGFSFDLNNVFQNSRGVISPRNGNDILFSSDEDDSTSIAEVGSCTILGTKYYFQFAGGAFSYSTLLTGAKTKLSPAPAIVTANQVWWAVLDDKLFFVDGSNNLRFFDGTDIKDSVIYQRPTVAPTSASGAGAFTYVYTVDNGLGESPVVSTVLPSIVSAATIRIPGNTGPQTLIAGDVVRIYSRADSIAAASKLVATYTWKAADVTAGHSDIATVAISDLQPQLYTELGQAVNVSAPAALVGIVEHYGRLIGWAGDYVYPSKESNPHSWPGGAAAHEAFIYGYGVGDGEGVQVCVPYRESLFVFKKTKLAEFGGVGPDDVGNNGFTFRRIETNGRGCSAPKSVKVVGDEKKNYMIFRSQMGFYATNGSEPVRIGEKIEPATRGVSLSNQYAGVAFHHKREGVYVHFEGAAGSKTAWVLDVREDNGILVGWFKWTGINVTAVWWDDDRYIFGTSGGYCGVERITGISSDFSDARVEFVLPGAIDTATDRITVANSYATGDPVRMRTNGTIPGGITANTTYFAIRISATVIKLATSNDNAQAGTAIDITTAGVGTHSIVAAAWFNPYYTTNWMHFGSSTRVKKLSKLGMILNAEATSVNIDVAAAYDWVDVFSAIQTVSVGSADQWGQNAWGSGPWGSGSTASPRNVSIPRRKVRAIRYKFSVSAVNRDFNLQGIEQQYQILRNRGNFA
jgi:hypothetical protein